MPHIPYDSNTEVRGMQVAKTDAQLVKNNLAKALRKLGVHH